MNYLTRIAILFLLAGCLTAQQRPNGLYAIFDTAMGSFTAKLYEKDVPVTVRNFVALAQGTKITRDFKTGKPVYRRLYDNIVFHRVVRDEMIQSGDPSGTGAFGCGFTIPDEYLPGLRFDQAGKLAMANTGKANTGGCQFFITVNAIPAWNNQYTVFGYIVEGLDVVAKINHQPLHGDKPVDPVKLNTVRLERVGPMPVAKSKK